MSLLFIATLGCTQPTLVEHHSLDSAFGDAAHDFDVPRDLLVTISYALTRIDDRGGMASMDDRVGLMELRTDAISPSVQDGMEILGLSYDTIANDPVANIRTGAAILAGMAQQHEQWSGEPVDTMQEWYPVVSRYVNADPLVSSGFADQVYRLMEYGFATTLPGGEWVEVTPQFFNWRDGHAERMGSSLISQYIPASTSNYTDASRTSSDIDSVVIHTTEGSYSGAISWFQDSAASAAAHYVIRSSDGEITQMLDEEDVGWHAGHWETNQNSIGIEHEGYTSQPETWYTDAMIRASAALVKDICDRHGIPKDRDHIIGHFEVPGCANPLGGGTSCHTDPGDGWDWDYFIELVNSGDSPEEILNGNLPDGPRAGQFSATIYSSNYGITDTCSGPLEGAANNGMIYLSGACRLDDHGEQSGEIPIAFQGTEQANNILDGQLSVDGYTNTWSGQIHTDGSTTGSSTGVQDIGGDIGTLSYSLTLTTNP